VRQHISAEEVNLDPEISTLLQRRLGLSPSVYAKVVYGNGVAPLFASLAEGCLQEEGTFLFPEGCYGYFYATAQFYGLKIGHIPTNREHQFKITPAQLEASMQGVERPWVYLNFPVVNPTGSIYTPSELTALLNVLKKRQAKVVIDSIFAGLEFGEAVPYSLDAHIWQMPLVILGGISKEYAAGGLRLGYAYTQNDFLHECLRQHTKAQPHHTVKYAMKRLLQAQENNAGLLSDLRQQRAILAKRAEKLANALEETGWKPLRGQGGLFMAAAPMAYLGKEITVSTPQGDRTYILDSSNISEALFYATGLLINNAVWTGIPEHCRFVLSVSDEAFEQALNCLQVFHAMI
jgi:methionine S-methyltransferase